MSKPDINPAKYMLVYPLLPAINYASHLLRVTEKPEAPVINQDGLFYTFIIGQDALGFALK